MTTLTLDSNPNRPSRRLT